MALVDVKERQLTLKLVYYGPALSGKTTNLRWIHRGVDTLNRGRLMTLDTRDDRTLFFDLLPIFFKTSKLSFRVKVYTVPGQPMHEATRRLVLTGADGVAFVANAQRAEIRANNDSYQNLLMNLSALGLDRAKVPIVIQYNKCDLPDVLTEDEVDKLDLTAEQGEPVYRSIALEGVGVAATFFGLLDHTWTAVDEQLHIEKLFKITREDFLSAVHEHMNLR